MATATYGALPEISKAARTCGSQAFNRQKLRSVGQFLYPLLETYSSISPSCSGQESDKLAPESPQIPSTGMAAPKSRRTSPGRGNRWSFGPPPSGRPVSGSLPWKDTTSSEEPATPSADGEDTVISSPGGEPQIWHRGCALEISSPKGPKTCAQCGSSKTPLWRNGPPGPKSLCNACGIRYNKMKAGKRSRAPTNEEILMAPSSPVPVQKPVAAPLFASRMMGKARDAAMEASFLHWQHASRGSLEQMPRKRSRTLHHPRIMLGATKLECREEGNGSDDEASRKNADMSRSSNGSSSGDSCITAKGRRTISPTWTSRSPEQQVEIPPLCLNSHATPAKGFTGKPFGDDTEGAELLMVLFYGADKWQSKVLPAMLTA